MSGFEKGAVIVSLADHRAAVLARQMAEREEAAIAADSAAASALPLLTALERIWWRNLVFIGHRMATSSRDYGAIKLQAVKVGGDLMLDLSCEVMRAFYHLDERMIVDVSRPPLLVEWRGSGSANYPISDLPEYEVIHD